MNRTVEEEVEHEQDLSKHKYINFFIFFISNKYIKLTTLTIPQ